jgi:predicted ester cyclase
MSIEANKALVRRLFAEVYNGGRYELADELIAPGYVTHNALDIDASGPEGVKRAAAMQLAAFPDMHTTIEDLRAEGDRVVVRGRDRVTHKGDFMGYAPTGKTWEITWVDIFRVENGKLVESWLEIDMERMRKLLRGEVN